MGCRRSRVASLKKQKPRIARGPLLSKVHPPLERVSIRFAAFRSSNVIGINVALPRWIRRVAFFRTAARARSCGHPFFMLRFLARGSAGTDGSVIGHAGRGLALSRRNERRAEERRNDKSRDCKLGSHQKCLHGVTRPLQTSTGDLVPLRDQHCANFISQRIRVWPLRNICPKCYDTKTLVAPISSATEVSISTRPLRTSRDLCSRYRI